ncbi:hypothetical protein GF325_00875, partial [Candidatus Bathyarchaeota archaeon]|nr:hypothetical protein [Candidatus Bathyarchaeota archaeon]
LNAPDKQVPGNRDDPGKFTQKKIDLIDINANSFTTVSFRDLFDSLVSTGFLEMVTTKDLGKAEMLARRNRPGIAAYHISFKGILQGTNLVSNLRVMLDAIENAYGTPVDVEFTANFDSKGGYRLNLLQCRPFQVRMDAREITPIDGTNTGVPFLHTQGPIIGPSMSSHPGVLIMVRPKVFGRLAPRQRFAIARAIGKITHHPEISSRTIMILGPGRWGTSTVSLGIPVTFAEIQNVSIIGEIAEMHDGLIPDVSLGTHFFNDLVEMNMIYFAVYPGKKGYMLDVAPLEAMENQVSRYLQGDSLVENAIIVLEFMNDENVRIAGVNKKEHRKDPRAKYILGIFMDTLKQEGRCYLLRR